MRSALQRELAARHDPAKAAFFPRFFRCGPGEYGEGDRFLGVTVPDVRAVARRHRNLPLADIAALLADPVHEHRLAGLLVLVSQYERADAPRKAALVRFYLSHLRWVNNWDLVDASAAKILGDSLVGKDQSILDALATSGKLWKQRIAIVATYASIRGGDVRPTFRIARQLLRHPHDLIHKAVGWMLREASKRDRGALQRFLDAHAATMPRTMLRYAIERFEPAARRRYLSRRAAQPGPTPWRNRKRRYSTASRGPYVAKLGRGSAR